MSFIAVLDRFFDDKNLLDLLYGYYLQYVGVAGQYRNIETLEVIDVIPKLSIKRTQKASIIGNTFIINDKDDKCLFQLKLD